MEIVKVLSPVQDNNIQKNLNGSPIWVGKRYHESELAIAEKENPILYEYSFKFDGLRCVQFTGVKKLAK
jgi:polysaccharide pyruvyl transferase WcaK-like protein